MWITNLIGALFNVIGAALCVLRSKKVMSKVDRVTNYILFVANVGCVIWNFWEVNEYKVAHDEEVKKNRQAKIDKLKKEADMDMDAWLMKDYI